MARGMAVVEKNLKELENEITCCICQEHYTDPKVLPCLHCYCKQCILSLALRKGKYKPFSCPECRKEATLPEGNEDKLPTAFPVNRIIALYNKQDRALNKEEVKCEICVNRVSSKAEINKLSEVILFTTELCSKPAKHGLKIDCHLKSLRNGSLIKTQTKEIGANQYRINFIPTLRGRYELTVSVDRKQVAGSPFPVFVSIPPTQLGQPVKVWVGLANPNGIAVNSVGEIIVAESKGDVVVLDKEGKRLRSLNRSEHQFGYLRGVAVDAEDNIYFTDQATNQIFKSNKNCSNVQVHKVQQVNGPGHLDVALVGDEVMVTERANEGRVMVYDKELNYLSQIVNADNTMLWGVSSDGHQNVYVSDPGNSSIQVFSNNGEFLRSFGCDENGVKKLKSPWGVCVAGQYVYVADERVDKIVVFNTEGDYVTSFGSRSHYVCVDQDGFVYASYHHYNKIDIF